MKTPENEDTWPLQINWMHFMKCFDVLGVLGHWETEVGVETSAHGSYRGSFIHITCGSQFPRNSRGMLTCWLHPSSFLFSLLLVLSSSCDFFKVQFIILILYIMRDIPVNCSYSSCTRFKGHYDRVLLNFEISILIVTILWFFYCVFYTIKLGRIKNSNSIDLYCSI